MVTQPHLRRRRLTLAVALAVAATSTSVSASIATTGPATSATVTPADARPRIIPLPPPSRFVRLVTNPYLPWSPGTRWIYRGYGSEGHERDVVLVLERTKQIEGITATVVRDVVRRRGRLIERTFDWYAQDRRGRVWYLGENTHAFEDGQVDTEGSWEAGADGAQPGIAMFHRPVLNRRYWQEYYAGHAEDQGVLVERSTQVTVPFGRLRHVRMTEDTSPLEASVTEFKFYARGVGSVLELDVSPDQGRVELVRMTRRQSVSDTPVDLGRW
jgi:hypothetical protein